MNVAIVTGASRGLGEALAAALLGHGWAVVIDGRSADALESAGRHVSSGSPGRLVVVPGDVTDPTHRRKLVASAGELGGLDLLVNNASTLGATPLRALAEYPLDELAATYHTNVVAPLALIQEAIPLLRTSADPRILNITSDASVGSYEGWGGYGSSKAALDQISAVLAVEEPGFRVWALDPGDMRTRMHQDAFPGEDISDRPLPAAIAPLVLGLIEGDLKSGRYVATELVGAPS